MHGRMADLYDVFVDWEGRLGREMPGLVARLRRAGARRVLDAGCGTGRHVAALLESGLDAVGADLSPEMLDRAPAHLRDPERLWCWRLGDPPPPGLVSAAPFDAVVSLGNVWPQILRDADLAAAGNAFRRLLRPGGLVLVGLKAFELRRERGEPHLPLLRREHEGRSLHFVRFLDFAVPPGDDGAHLADFHMAALRGDGDDPVHRVSRVRLWSPAGLEEHFRGQGFKEVSISARLDDPHAAPATEDVFVHATTP
jgi:SAM-dependent methyltransferase